MINGLAAICIDIQMKMPQPPTAGCSNSVAGIEYWYAIRCD
jgi:hypothetical protein